MLLIAISTWQPESMQHFWLVVENGGCILSQWGTFIHQKFLCITLGIYIAMQPHWHCKICAAAQRIQFN